MAKKTLINADMLLATPRRVDNTPAAAPAIEPEVVAIKEEPKVAEAIAPPSVVEPVAQMNMTPASVPEVTAPVNSVQKGLKAGETRATFIVQEDALEKIKAIAYWDRKNIKEVMNSALIKYIAEYESKNGTVQPIP